MRERFQKQRHATTVGVTAAREHQLQLGRSQEEMLDHFLVRNKRVGTADRRSPRDEGGR
jgi:hypothetical protein